MSFLRILLCGALLFPALVRAEVSATPTPTGDGTIFEKPNAAEHEANGFDPEGVEYHQNRLEDFQVYFVETAPFAALVSYGLTVAISLATHGKGKLDKKNLPYFAGGTVLLAAGTAYYDVSSKTYIPPKAELSDLGGQKTAWAVRGEFVRIHF